MTESRELRPGTVAVIILTYNEELNLPQALESVVGWARQVFVVDSGSTDRTMEIAWRYGCHVVQHPLEDYTKQRNFALSDLLIEAAWIFFLDADEWLPAPLKEEIANRLAAEAAECGFLVKRRLIWMDRWILRGHVRCEERQVNEHLIVKGPVGRLEHDFMHEDRKGLAALLVYRSSVAPCVGSCPPAKELKTTKPGGDARPDLGGMFFRFSSTGRHFFRLQSG